MKSQPDYYAYNPHSPYSTPFTIFADPKQVFKSKSLQVPCMFEVYCPYSCKKIKIGISKDNKNETLQFNTTTNRIVSFFANANQQIRYLVNKHKPNKKDKKVVTGEQWSACIEVEDKGNIAIFNPYCVDPFNPISFYTFDKFQGEQAVPEILKFGPKQNRQATILQLGKKKLFLSNDNKWIGSNPYFNQQSCDQITLTNPRNSSEQLSISTAKIVSICKQNLNNLYSDIQKFYEMQNRCLEYNENLKPKNNIDVTFTEIEYYLNIMEQIRARLMNDSCKDTYSKYFKQHPRLYTAWSRLGSFLNYGCTKYDIVKLAELGFFNRSDMLQDLRFVELLDQDIVVAEEENIKDQMQLRAKLFPFCRSVRGFPFPNISLQTTLTSLHSQLTTKGQIVKHVTLDPYILFADTQGKISLWSCQMMVHKMIQFDYSKDYKQVTQLIPTTHQDKKILEAQVVQQKIVQKPEQKTQIVATEVKQQGQGIDENMMKTLLTMGYKQSIVKKALLQGKGQQIDAVIDLIQKMQKQAPKKKPNKEWSCKSCTFKNKANATKCEMCGQYAPDQQQDKKALLKALQQQRKHQQQIKRRQQQQQLKREQQQKRLKEQQQKIEKQKLLEQKQKQIKNSKIIDITFFKTNKTNIDPFFVSIILLASNGEYVVRTFRVGLVRRQMLKFYRVEDHALVSNFDREIYGKKEFIDVDRIIGNSRQQIQWGIKFFEDPSQKIWTVISCTETKLQGIKPRQIKLKQQHLIIQSESTSIVYKICLEDNLKQSKFSLVKISEETQQFKCVLADIAKKQVSLQQQADKKVQNEISCQNEIVIGQKVEEVLIEFRQFLQPGQWKNLQTNKQAKISSPSYSQNLIMSEFLPLKIQSNQGSIFSHKYSSTSMLQKLSQKNNIYVSNYPDVSFIFKSIDNKPMLIESVTIVSKNVKMNKIYPISSGLIFTANQISWFEIGKEKFRHFNKQKYQNWQKWKIGVGEQVAFWEPVGYFDVLNQVQVQIVYKRVAKYVFLLPTGVNKKDNVSDDGIAVKIDFFGAKGRIQEQVNQAELYQLYRNQGTTPAKVQVHYQSSPETWSEIPSQSLTSKYSTSASTFMLAPPSPLPSLPYLPLSTSTLIKMKFKNVPHSKKITIESNCLKQFKIVSFKESTTTLEKVNVGSFKDLIHVQGKMSQNQLEAAIQGLDMSGLVTEVLKGMQNITRYEALLSKIIAIPGYDLKLLETMSDFMQRICQPDIKVTDTGFKSFIRLYQKLLPINQPLSSTTIQKSWLSTTSFIQKNRNKNYNILRNTYKIEQLVLQQNLFNKDYYRLIHPNYIQEQKISTISTEPQTPINNRMFVEMITDFHYQYYVDLLGYDYVEWLELYFGKLGNQVRYKMGLRIWEIREEDGQVVEKQIYYRYFHQDYLLQLSQKAFKDTEIFVKSHINFCSIPGHLITPGTRLIKLNVSFVLLSTNPPLKQKPQAEPYIILPLIVSKPRKSVPYTTHPIQNFLPTIDQYPASPKHNSTQQRLPPHRYNTQSHKSLYIIHEFKNKHNTSETKNETINKIQKLIQNILDKTIVQQTINNIKINDFGMGEKGLDFGYIYMISLFKLWRKLTCQKIVGGDVMIRLFQCFVVYQYGPIKNVCCSVLIELYNRLGEPEKSQFVERIIDNYVLDSQKIRNLKISQKYPIQKILSFLSDLKLTLSLLFHKLSSSTSASSITLLILIIINNNKTISSPFKKLTVYSSQSVGTQIKTYKPHQLLSIIFKKCNWILSNTAGLCSEILDLGLSLLLSFVQENSNNKVDEEDFGMFVQEVRQEEFWRLIFGTFNLRNDLLNDKIDSLFKVFVDNITDNFQKGINNILLQIIVNSPGSLYRTINPDISDQSRMSHLKTILQYLSLTNKKLFLDTETAVSLLQLPLTPTLWSLALKIIPRQDKILIEIIKKFNPELYSSLGNEIMDFCQPLAGIRKLQSNHINWLDLVKKIRLEGRSLFQLFIQQLKQCNFGGKNGLTMAMVEDVIKLEIADQFAKLVAENKIDQKGFTQHNIRVLVSWFFMNYTKQKGASPATQILTNLSKNVLNIFEKVTSCPALIPKFIKIILEIRKQGETVEKIFEQKRISSCNAIELNKKFCQCFELLINLLCVNDEQFNYFAFEINGLEYMLEKAGLSDIKSKQPNPTQPHQAVNIPDQQFLLNQGLITTTKQQNPSTSSSSQQIFQLKEQETATNVQLVPNKNPHSVTSTNLDWTIYKKANKTKIIFLPMNGSTHHQFQLFVSFLNATQVRSIKIGFPAASYQMGDKLVVAPEKILLEGGIDLKNMEAMGEMEKLDDEGYISNGVRVFVLNLQKMKGDQLNLSEAVSGLHCFRVKYLKIIIKRPVVTFIQGQYSPLNAKAYTNLGCSISFLSVLGDNLQKRRQGLLTHCKQLSKSSSLTILGTIITQSNPQTLQKISNSPTFIQTFKNRFSIIKQHLINYSTIVPNIVYSLGSSNQQLGDWIIHKFLSQGTGEIQAKLLNQIVMSSATRVYRRLDIFLKQVLRKIDLIANQSDIQANIKYAESVSFIDSFCRTLEQSYDFAIEVPTTLNCSFKNIQQIVTLYDKKYSSPEIKTFTRLLINLLYLRQPLVLSQNLQQKTLNLIWQNCSQSKPYFYDLLASLLLPKSTRQWIQSSNHQKLQTLVPQILSSIESNNQKLLHPQLHLLYVLSFHQKQYLSSTKTHLLIYNKIKHLTVQNYEIFQFFSKLIQNIVLEDEKLEKEIAEQLIQDVDLLVKRKDQNLQMFYVGLLRTQKQINVNVKGFDVDSRNNTRKDTSLSSKILNKVHTKSILQKISKKIRFNLSHQLDISQLKYPLQKSTSTELYDKIYNAMNGTQFLLIIKLRLINNKTGAIGIYSPGRSFRSEEDSYCWEDVINYQKGAFLFLLTQGEIRYVQVVDAGQQMLSLFGGEEQTQNSLIFYEKNTQILKFPLNFSSEPIFNLPNTTAIKIESIQIFNGSLRPCSTQPKLLASTTKASTPFTHYRTSSIYIFPHRITIQKFMNIIGIKGKCKRRGKILNENEVLGVIGEQSQDFIADVEIVQEEVEEGAKQEGYFPIMRIFEQYSALGGVNKVLQIGSQSIKDWRKPQRRKCFQHYMSELKNFVHLPSFFNHYIKNQQSISFLFEVASGMPDDPHSQKNWQQQQIKSSKFIYKILADIYKYDKSPQLRDMNKYEQFCELILQKLAQISKQTVRTLTKQNEKNENEGQNAGQTGQNEKNKQKNSPNVVGNDKKKKKGTGYSSDNQNTSKWTTNQWMEYRKLMNQEIQRVIAIFVSFLECDKPLTDDRLADKIKNSCLLPLIQSALRSGSLLDISKQADLFRSYLAILKNLASNPSTISCLLQLDQRYKPVQTQSIYKLLSKLHGIAQIFIDCLKSGKASQQNEVAAIIATQIQKVFYLVDKAVKNIRKGANAITIKQIDSMPVAQAYRLLLSGLRFGYVDMKKKQDYAHFYANTIPKGSPPTAKILRLSQQLADLSSSLPCEHTNSIFVRCDKSRIDVIKILIMGSKDTPYSNGAFMFDLFCDDSYPNNPPKMSITTTGSGKIRFNPNLYSCGKVCLSLLGTWRGQASENWDPKISTLLQLFISTQGITMSEDLYFNQPGFDSEQGTVEGEKKNEAYANIVRLGNVKFAMIDQIKNPPKGFEDVVSRHFYLKKKQILEQVQKWLQYADTKQASYVGIVNDHNSSWCGQLKPKGKYKQLLLKQYHELKQILQSLPQPNLKQKQQESSSSPIEDKKIKKKTKTKQAKIGQIDVSYQPEVIGVGIEAQKQLAYEENVMQDRWSRYIGAMGIQSVKKQAQSKVVLVGLGTLGLEIAKNLVLSGLKELSIVDCGVYESGVEEHFYMSDIKSKNIEDCVFKIKELNPYMLVKSHKQIPNLEGYNIVVTTQPLKEAMQLSTRCRKMGIKFIHAQTCGVSGLYFADLGKQFVVEDPNGQQPFEAMIKSITCGQNGVVTLLDGIKHPYQDGDYIVLQKVEGMQQKQSQMQQSSPAQLFYNKMSNQKQTNAINGRVFQIKVINWNSFSIGNTTNYTQYIKGGICKNINIPKKLEFEEYGNCVGQFEKFVDGSLGIYDFEKMGDNLDVFLSFKAYSQFLEKHKRKPNNWQLKDSLQLQNILKSHLPPTSPPQSLNKSLSFCHKFSLIAQSELPTLGAYFGGLVSQQIIKALTNKYTPIKQFFTFHFNEMIQQIPSETEEQKYKQKHIQSNQIFKNLKIVIGRENAKKIEEMKIFVIGAGAIGCELLKNFAMVNMGAQGMITVTDPDHIQTSNLTRQFLFRQKHVKKPKSATAAATLIQMNPLLKNHISARLDKVSEQTQDIYSDEFFDNQTVVANALDNVKARVYVDARCVINSKPLFQSGTLGPKGHVQVIVPHKTQNYGNQNDPTEQNQIPHCTLKMFPEETVHCIQWSRDIFGKVFTLNPKALKKVIQAKDVSAAEGQQKSTISKMIEYMPSNFDDCVAEAVRKFYKYFRNNVRQLLHTYPLDLKTKDGNLFWTLPKRPPKQINEIDFSDATHQKFISSYAVLLAKIYNIPFPKNFRTKQGIQTVIAIAKSVKPEQFVPNEQQSKKLQKMAEKQQKNEQSVTMQQKQTQQQQAVHNEPEQQIKIELNKQLLQTQIKPEQFEKDEDSNGHIDLIFSMSNLRARNYGLNQCTWIQAKLKAGKIMAALSTTTSVVSALQTIQIIKLVSGSKLYRNAFVNLAVPLIQISQPGQVPKHKIGNTQFTVWDTWEFKAETLKDLIKQIYDKYGVQAYNISTAAGVPVYWEAMYVGKEEAAEDLLNKPLNKIFAQKTSLNILMRSKEDKKPFENVPRVIVQPPAPVQ